jgi:pimeloyl-ACP methyl ester carboxylesterase
MPAVFVHGNPETAAIWDELFTHLARKDAVALSPPGFGVPVPPQFDATADAYLHWLAGELERIGGAVDLVGHDWGGAHVLRLAMARPDLIRSWVSDIAGCFEPDYVWHDMAQTWQTPGAGEDASRGRLPRRRPCARIAFVRSVWARRPIASRRRSTPTWGGAFSRCIGPAHSRRWRTGDAICRPRPNGPAS